MATRTTVLGILLVTEAAMIAQTAAQSIATDGSFERPGLAFAKHDAVGAWVRRLHDAPDAAIELADGAGRGGSRCVRYARTGTRSTNIHLDQLIAVQRNTVYQVTAWVKGDGKLNPLLVVQTEKWATLARTAVGSSDEWREATVLFNSYENDRVRIEWFPGATGTLYTGAPGESFLDDVSVVALGRVPQVVSDSFELARPRKGELIRATDMPQHRIGHATTCRPITCRDGVLMVEDGTEVALWGVNIQTALSWEWRGRLQLCGIPETAEALKRVTDENLAHLPPMGVRCVRLHLLPSDFSDAHGNLSDSVYLDVLDYLVSRCRDMGIYVYLTLMNEMKTLHVKDSFMAGHEREEWLFDADFMDCSERYITALLNHRNRYNDTPYRSEPAIAVVELINEPRYPRAADVTEGGRFANCRDDFRRWCEAHGVGGAPEQLFPSYRYDRVKAYLSRMHTAIRATGCDKAVAWNLNWPRMIQGHEDVFQAAADSPVEAVSFCCYPGQRDVKSPFWAHPADLSGNNYLGYLEKCGREYYFLGWVLGRRFASKAKLVYEFENMYNHSTSYIYPAMARLFRSLGAQIAPMWQYTLSPVAEFMGGSHYLNLHCTPAKAVAFRIAAEAFRSTPRYAAFDLTDDGSAMSFGPCSLSFQSGISEWVSGHTVMHSGPLATLPAEIGGDVRHIAGVGPSPLVTYEGTGAYFIEPAPGGLGLTILPDAEYLRPPWKRVSRKPPLSRLCRLDSAATHRFEVRLPDGFGNATVTRLAPERETVAAETVGGRISFDVRPGKYLLARGR